MSTPLVRAGTFSEALHPRDRKGKFAGKLTEEWAAAWKTGGKPGTPHAAREPAGHLPFAAGVERRDRSAPVLSPEAYEALRPAEEWPDWLPEDVEANLGKSPDAKLLGQFIEDWQVGEDIEGMRRGIDTFTNGRPIDPDAEQRSRVVLNAIRNTPDELIPPSLHRGLGLPGTADSVLAQYKPGSTINLNVTSFTSDVGYADEFAHGSSQPVRVMMELVGDKKALPIQNFSANPSLFDEAEFIAAGEFKVMSAATDASGAVQMKIQQVGVL